MYIKEYLDNKRQYILCRPDKKEVGVLKGCKVSFKEIYQGVDELTIDIPMYIENSKSHKKQKNKIYDLAIGGYFVCKYDLTNKTRHYFIIKNENKQFGNNGMKIEKKKTIQCFSLEHNLSDIDFPVVQGTYQLYRDEKDVIQNGDGILNFIESVTNWKIGFISDKAKNTYTKVIEKSKDDSQIVNEYTDIQRKYRIFDINNKKITNVIKEEIEKAYDVICLFDTDKEEINVYHKDEIGEFKDLYVSDGKYLKSLNNKSDFEKIVTQLYVHGRDNLSINELNPLGTSYLEDFSYYRNEKYMDKEMLEAFNNYDKVLNENQIKFEDTLKKKNDLTAVKNEYETQLVDLQSKLKRAIDSRDIAIRDNRPLDSYNQNVVNTEIKVKELENKIIDAKNKMELYDEVLNNIAKSIDKNNNFTKEQLKIIKRSFIKTDVWSNDNYSQTTSESESYKQKKELYLAGLEALKLVNQPNIEFDIDIVDLFKITGEKHQWNKVKKGDFIEVEIKENNTFKRLRIIEINGVDNDDKNSLKITVSNSNEKNDTIRYLSNSMGSIRNSANEVKRNKFKWDTIETANKTVKELREGNLDASKNAVLAGQNQSIKLDSHGISMKNFLDEKRQLKIINDCLAMTTDGWQTASLAITPEGIMADRLVGRIILGEGLDIKNKNNSLKIDETGIRCRSDAFIIEGGIPDEMLSSSEKWNRIEDNMKNYVNDKTDRIESSLLKLDNAFEIFGSDDVLTASEAQTLELQLKQLDSESNEIVKLATDLQITDELIAYVQVLENLKQEMKNWIELPKYPVKILDINRDTIKKLFKGLQLTKTALTNKINQTLSNNAENNAKEYANKQIEQVDLALNTLETDIGKFSSDGYISLVESKSLETQLIQVQSESLDLITLAKSLTIAEEVNNYTNSLTTLQTVINRYINKTVYPIQITPIDRHLILDTFQEVQKFKTILSNKIKTVLSDNAVATAKSYTNSQFQVLNKEISARVKQVDFDDLSEKVQQAELKITPDAIKSTVFKDYNYNKETKVPIITKLICNRNSQTINPLNTLNYTGGSIVQNNSFSKTDTGKKEYNYTSRYEIIEDEFIKYSTSSEGIINLNTQVNTSRSDISQLQESIKLSVTATQLETIQQQINGQIIDTKTRVTNTESSISLLQENLNLKVSKDNVIASINLSPETIKLNANKLDLTGLVTINNLATAGSVVINGGNIKGGTLELGGSNNGNGSILMKNSLNKELIKIDNHGLKITMHQDENVSGGYNTALQVMDYMGVQLLTLDSQGFFKFSGVISIKNPDGSSLGLDPKNIQFYNPAFTKYPLINIKLSDYEGTLEVGNVLIGNEHIQKMGYLNFRGGISGLKVYNGNTALGPIYGSSKNAITPTISYGDLVTYADESPNHVFHDSGYGIIDDSGYCTIFFDRKYLETVTTNKGDYLVYLTGYVGCNVELVSTNAMGFIVKGNVGKRFNWLSRCERKGMERLRWNEADIFS